MQDTTRSFLDGGTEKKDRAKFDLYRQATMLDRIAEYNQRAEEVCYGMLQAPDPRFRPSPTILLTNLSPIASIFSLSHPNVKISIF